MRKKKYSPIGIFFSLFFGVFVAVTAHAAPDENLLYAKEKTTSLDLELSRVSVRIAAFDEKRIAYRYEVAEGKKLSCIETQKTLRIRQIIPSHGTLYLFIPKEMLLENCNIRISCADFSCEDIQAVHFQLVLNRGSSMLSACTLKNAVVNLAQGSFSLADTQIIKSCACTLTNAVADIRLPSGEEEYHIDYAQNGQGLSIAGSTVEKKAGEHGNPKARRRIILSGSGIKASIQFKKKSDR